MNHACHVQKSRPLAVEALETRALLSVTPFSTGSSYGDHFGGRSFRDSATSYVQTDSFHHDRYFGSDHFGGDYFGGRDFYRPRPEFGSASHGDARPTRPPSSQGAEGEPNSSNGRGSSVLNDLLTTLDPPGSIVVPSRGSEASNNGGGNSKSNSAVHSRPTQNLDSLLLTSSLQDTSVWTDDDFVSSLSSDVIGQSGELTSRRNARQKSASTAALTTIKAIQPSLKNLETKLIDEVFEQDDLADRDADEQILLSVGMDGDQGGFAEIDTPLAPIKLAHRSLLNEEARDANASNKAADNELLTFSTPAPDADSSQDHVRSEEVNLALAAQVSVPAEVQRETPPQPPREAEIENGGMIEQIANDEDLIDSGITTSITTELDPVRMEITIGLFQAFEVAGE